jgi:hypothetical protein
LEKVGVTPLIGDQAGQLIANSDAPKPDKEKVPEDYLPLYGVPHRVLSLRKTPNLTIILRRSLWVRQLVDIPSLTLIVEE